MIRGDQTYSENEIVDPERERTSCSMCVWDVGGRGGEKEESKYTFFLLNHIYSVEFVFGSMSWFKRQTWYEINLS